jgi:hypothetical protein
MPAGSWRPPWAPVGPKKRFFKRAWKPAVPEWAPEWESTGPLRGKSSAASYEMPTPREKGQKPPPAKYPRSMKPGRLKPHPKPLIRYPDGPGGREIIDTFQPEGFKEYRQRVRLMLERQKGVCCLSRLCPKCPGALRLEDAVFEHEYPRGLGGCTRDDRIERDGKRLNGAAHWNCNRWKMSRRITYNRT